MRSRSDLRRRCGCLGDRGVWGSGLYLRFRRGVVSSRLRLRHALVSAEAKKHHTNNDFNPISVHSIYLHGYLRDSVEDALISSFCDLLNIFLFSHYVRGNATRSRCIYSA